MVLCKSLIFREITFLKCLSKMTRRVGGYGDCGKTFGFVAENVTWVSEIVFFMGKEAKGE